MREACIVFRETPRLVLCEPRLSDIEGIVSLWTDPQVTEFIGGPRDRELVAESFQEYALDFEAAQRRWGDRWWTIIERASDRFVGLISLLEKEIEGSAEIELNYFLLPVAWGPGYAVEAAREVRDYAFEELGLKSLVAIIHPGNVRSQAVASKLGMVLDREIVRPGGSVKRLYRLLSGTWLLASDRQSPQPIGS